jgi:rhodanese-related sulfurtransferase
MARRVPVLALCAVLTGVLSAGTCWGEAPVALEGAARVQRVESMYAAYRLGFPLVPEQDVAALVENGVPEGALLVDVREPAEREVSMLPGAITREAFEADREAFRGKVVIVYCTIGARSGLYAKGLRAEGFDARNLPGSVLAWSHAGGTFVNAAGPTRRVHVYGPEWSLLADGYEATW